MIEKCWELLFRETIIFKNIYIEITFYLLNQKLGEESTKKCNWIMRNYKEDEMIHNL